LIVTFFAGKIDILVNNAGFGLGGYIESVSVDEAKVSKIFNLS
jgi:short-subunit dehydrogenase